MSSPELPTAYITQAPEGTYYQIPADHTFQSTEVEMQEVLYGMVRYIKPDIVFESGSCLGFGTMALAMACNSNQHGIVISAEPDEDRYKIAKERAAQWSCAEVRNCTSAECPELKTADFIFSDSSWEARRAEWTAAKRGCVFVVHDTRIELGIRLMVKSNHGLVFDRGRGFGMMIKE